MSSRKDKKPSLDGTGLLDDLLLDQGMGALAESDLGQLLDPAGADDAMAGLDYENMSNEQVVEHETSAVLAAFKERARKEQERFELATDSEYWVALCFQTRAQKEAFLKAVKLLQAGDKYLDGRLLAKRMGIELPAADVPFNTSAKPDAKLAAMVRQARP